MTMRHFLLFRITHWIYLSNDVSICLAKLYILMVFLNKFSLLVKILQCHKTTIYEISYF